MCYRVLEPGLFVPLMLHPSLDQPLLSSTLLVVGYWKAPSSSPVQMLVPLTNCDTACSFAPCPLLFLPILISWSSTHTLLQQPWIPSTAAFLWHRQPLVQVMRNSLFKQLLGRFSSLFCLWKEIYKLV